MPLSPELVDAKEMKIGMSTRSFRRQTHKTRVGAKLDDILACEAVSIFRES